VGEEIDREEFERHWLRAASSRKGDVPPADETEG
jgi:hypothetical protein